MVNCVCMLHVGLREWKRLGEYALLIFDVVETEVWDHVSVFILYHYIFYETYNSTVWHQGLNMRKRKNEAEMHTQY